MSTSVCLSWFEGKLSLPDICSFSPGSLRIWRLRLLHGFQHLLISAHQRLPFTLPRRMACKEFTRWTPPIRAIVFPMWHPFLVPHVAFQRQSGKSASQYPKMVGFPFGVPLKPGSLKSENQHPHGCGKMWGGSRVTTPTETAPSRDGPAEWFTRGFVVVVGKRWTHSCLLVV